ncbi:MAG: hypothetical protein PHE20_02085 [Patescibacteria group bacterium]|nr:hypothetical protein [Patescibacteria group bacterium]
MDLKEFLFLIKHKRQSILIIVLTALIITLIVSLLFPLRYEAKSRLLITQDTGQTDAYTVSRSNEYLGNLFTQVASSGSFFDLSLSSPYNIDESYFAGTYAQQIKKWQGTVKTKTIADSGIIEISIYHPVPYQAQQIALAVNDVMINKKNNYQGNGDKVRISVIDQPLISTYPVKPNLIQNAALAFLFGFIFSLFFIYIFPEDRYDIHLFNNKKKKHKKNKKEEATNTVWDKLPSSTHQHANDTHLSPNGNIKNILR